MHIKLQHRSNSSILIKFHNNEYSHKRAKNGNLIDNTCSTIIELVETYNYLGVYIDNRFKWKAHIIRFQKDLRKPALMLFYLSYCSTY